MNVERSVRRGMTPGEEADRTSDLLNVFAAAVNALRLQPEVTRPLIKACLLRHASKQRVTLSPGDESVLMQALCARFMR